MILSDADNRPPMLDKDLYDSWKSRMKLNMQNKEHRRMILESVENGPLIWPTVEENRVTRTKKYAELFAAKKIQADCDMKATKIIFQGERDMARQCTQPKRPRNATWYKYKEMLAEAQEARQILDEEQLAFLLNPGVPDGQAVQIIIPKNAAFQTEDHDTYDSNCDDISNAKAILMANISNYGSDVISEFDSVVKKKTTPNARTKGEWGFKHTKAIFNNEIIPFLKSLKDIFNVFDKDLLNEIMEVQTLFDQMDATVQQSSVDKQCLEIAKKELLLENDRLL
nr:hypothetical protein [Tanacetum cinerariifolium]